VFLASERFEATGVLAGIDAAVSKYPWIERDRLAIDGPIQWNEDRFTKPLRAESSL
jgi:hypothetical protein